MIKNKTNKTYTTYITHMSYFIKKFTISIVNFVYKKAFLYIRKFLVFAVPKAKITFKFIKKHKQQLIIVLVALPVAIIWGLLLYKWITAPRPANLGEATKDSSYYFQGSSNLYTVKIGDKKTNEPKIEFSLGKNKSVTFSPASASSGIPVPTEKDNTVTFKNVYPNTDYTYKTIPLGIKEDITVHKPNGISVYPFFIETNGVTPKYYTTNLAGGVFYDEKGNYLFNFEKPFAVDAKGTRTDKVGITIKKDDKTAKLVGLLTVDADWLKDPARVYPITIDPTVVHDTTAEFATGQFNRVADIGTGFITGATGGAITYANGYTIHTFTSGTVTFTPSVAGNVEVLVVAGGGGGKAGGGGAGGLIYKQAFTVTTSPITATVGNGGPANTAGSNSIFGSLTAVGGGRGGTNDTTGPEAAQNGGSGGGGGRTSTVNPANGGSGTAGQGFAGGNTNISTSPYPGSGGGGAGGPGNPPVSNTQGGAGGVGARYDISGIFTYYAGGGGSGMTDAPGGAGAGGLGGGGGGGDSIGTAGTTNTGGGGGGGRVNGAGGGSGIVIVRYPTGPNLVTYYQELPTDINTAGLWHMNEASGTTTVSDSSGNGNTGTSSSSTNVGTGQLGNARSFNGSSDYINTGSNINLANASFTIEAWAKRGAIGTFHLILGQGPTSANNGLHFGFRNTNVFTCAFYANDLDTTSAYTDTEWHHWTCSYDASTNLRIIYRDGIEVVRGTASADYQGTGQFNIGAGYSTPAYFFNGSIDEVRISNIARTPEEIKLDAQRRPYSIYTSEVIDLAKLQSWNSLSWTELGVNTGDGETPYSTTGLVAQWNFNETSGTNANNDAEGTSCGGTPANCDGTLTGFASTGSQDAAAGTGWTANNRKWGAGALMFDGVNDYITIPDSSNFTFTDFSVEFWIRPNKNGTYDSPIGQYDNGTGATGDWWNFERPAGTTISFKVDDDVAATSADSTTILQPGNWYHVVGVRDQDSTLKIYINGKEEGSVAETAYTIDSSQSVYIGNQYANSRYFSGVLDSTRIYSRALTASEILSNYQAGNIELQTRVGNSTNADDGTWEEWRPVTGETAIASMNTDAANWAWDSSATYMPQLKSNESNIKMEGSGSLKQIIGQPQADANTVGLWHLDETGGTGAYLKDSTANANNGTPTGTTVANGFSGKARSFNGSESISLGNTSITDNATNLTVDAWVYTTTSDATHHRVFSEENVLYVGQYSNQVSLYMGNGSSWTNTSITMGTLTPNAWHHLAWVKSGTIANVYIDGVFSATITAPASLGTTSNINTIGTNDGGVQKWIGKLDEIRISNVARSSEEIAEAYRAGRDHYLNKTISSTDLFGKTSLPFYVASDRQGTFLNAVIGESAFANYQPDANTAGLWHLDENNSEAVYNYTGTDQTYTVPTGVTSINVKTWGGGGGGGNPGGWTYGFPGGGGGYTTGNISVTPGQVLTVAVGAGGTNGSIANQNPNYGGGARSCNTGSDCRYGGQGGGRSSIWYNGGDLMTAGGGGGGGSSRATNGEQGGAGGGNVGVAGTSYTAGYGGGGGTQSAGGTAGTGASAGTQYAGGNPASNAYGGSGGGGWYGGGGGGYLEPNDMGGGGGGSGYIGGTGVSGGVTTAGSGTTPGNSTDIARGTAGLGGAISTNGNPGKVIISYSYLKDSSGNGNHGTPVGTTFTQGKIGKARSFDGTSEYISIPHSTTLKPASQISISAWVRPTTGSLTALREIYRKEDGTDRHLLAFQPAANCASGVGCIAFGISTGGVYTEAEVNVVATDWENAWHYVVVTYDGSNKKIYKDGVLIGSIAATGAIGTTGTAASIIGSASGTGEFFSGLIDEVTVSNIARTADQIRQAYEIGARTYNITIDFKAALNSGNLIANISDLGFTIDATAYGASAMGSNLFLGDKIIVKENYDGTEYIAQGTVNSLNTSTGAVTVAAWDSGSTVPSGGFTVNATVFKWQREYFDIRGSRCTADTDADCDRYAVTNLTLRVTDGSQGSTVWLDDFRSNDGYLTTPAGSTIMSSTGDRYFQYRAIPVSYDTAVSPSLTSVTLDYTPNVAPNTPSLDLPADTTTGQSLTPVLKTTTTDTDLDNIQYKIQICTDLAMTLNCQTFDQTSSQTGWSGQNYPPGGPYTAYTSGAQGVYTVQTALDAGTTYYWRSYAIDPAGINTWSSTQTTPYSFTTTQPPSAPTLLLTQGLTNPTGVATLTPYFSAIHNDSEGDSANYYQIQVNTASDFSGTSMWDSGKTGMTLTANAARSPDITYAGSVPSWAATYYWRIKFWDTFGVGGAYSSAAQFTMDVASNAPTLDLPTNGATDQGLLTVFKTTATDPDSDYLRYKIQICTDLAMTLNCQTFDQTSSQTGWSGQDYPPGGPYTAYASATQAVYTIQTGLSPLTTYFWRSYAIDPAGTNTWGSTQTPYSFTTTNAPLAATSCRILETPDDTLLTVVWTDNATNEDNYEVQRSVDGANFSVLHTSLAAGTVSDVDSTVSDGHTYQYRVAPYLTAGPIYGGWCVTPMLSLQLGTFSIKGLDLKGLNLH